MPANRDRYIQLESKFLQLLHEAVPSTSESDPLVQEFASHLVTLTDEWATGSPTFPERAKWLAQWIEQNTSQPYGAAAAGNELELVEAGGDVETEAEAEAGVDG